MSNFHPIEKSDIDLLPFAIQYVYKFSNIDIGIRGMFVNVQGPGYNFFAENLTFKLFIDRIEHGEIYNEDLQIIKAGDLPFYYKSFSKGFHAGYEQFDALAKHKTALFENDRENLFNILFSKTLTHITGFEHYLIKTVQDKHYDYITTELLFDSGFATGEKYKAWYYIVNNHNDFINRFKESSFCQGIYKAGLLFWGGQANGTDIVRKLNEIRKIENINPLTQIADSEHKIGGGLSNGQIVDLFELLIKYPIIKEIDISDFIKCFYFGIKPNKYPTISHKALFVFTLSLITEVNEKTAFENFGIEEYDGAKTRLKKISVKHTAIKHKIRGILSKPIEND